MPLSGRTLFQQTLRLTSEKTAKKTAHKCQLHSASLITLMLMRQLFYRLGLLRLTLGLLRKKPTYNWFYL